LNYVADREGKYAGHWWIYANSEKTKVFGKIPIPLVLYVKNSKRLN
jgi:hypothetical protein